MPKASSQAQRNYLGLLYSKGKLSRASLRRHVKGVTNKKVPKRARKRKGR